MKSFIAFFSMLLSINICWAQLVLKDIFGRDLSGQDIILVDWEGYMSNPAIQLSLLPPTGASFPFTATLTADHSRLYFNTPSTAGASGPLKSITFPDANPIDFYISVFPDREDGDEQYTLTVSSDEGDQTYSVKVIDQDLPDPVNEYNILVDFSQDQPQYGFFENQVRRDIVVQAASDWAYFIVDMNFDTVAVNSELTWIWSDDFAGGMFVQNAIPYSGFLLFAGS